MLKNYCGTCVWKEGTSETCDNCFYSSLAEEKGVPPTGYEKGRTITNADRIRAMTDEELAKYLDGVCHDLWQMFVKDPQKMWLDWLKQEAT